MGVGLPVATVEAAHTVHQESQRSRPAAGRHPGKLMSRRHRCLFFWVGYAATFLSMPRCLSIAPMRSDREVFAWSALEVHQPPRWYCPIYIGARRPLPLFPLFFLSSNRITVS
jgi:hypothetical protein